MNYLVVIDRVIDKLRANNMADKAEDIISIRQAAATGGELLLTVTNEVVRLCKTDSTVGKLLAEEVRELQIICDVNGFLR